MKRFNVLICGVMILVLVGCGAQTQQIPAADVEDAVISEDDTQAVNESDDNTEVIEEQESVEEEKPDIKEYYIDIDSSINSTVSFIDNGTKVLGMNILPFTRIDAESIEINTGSQVELKTFDDADTLAYITVESSEEGIGRLKSLQEDFSAYAESREAYSISNIDVFIIPADEIETSVGTIQMYAVKENYSQPTFEKRGYLVSDDFVVEIIFMDYEKISNATYTISFNDFATGLFDMDYDFDLIYKAKNATEEAMADWEKYKEALDTSVEMVEDDNNARDTEPQKENVQENSNKSENENTNTSKLVLYSYTDYYGDTYTLSATTDKPLPGTTITWSGHAADAYNSITAQDGKGWINYDHQVNNIDQYTLNDELSKNGTVIWMNAWEEGFDVCLFWNTDGTIVVNPRP